MGSTSSPSRRNICRPLPHPRLSGSTVPPRGTVYVVERFGRFSRLLHASPNATPLLPLVDKVVAAFSARRVEQRTPPNGLVALVSARVPVHVHASWTLKVVDPKRLAYRVENVERCMQMLVHVRIRDAISALSPHFISALATSTSLVSVSDSVRQAIDETAVKFGISCLGFRMTAINPPPIEVKPRPRVLYYPQPVQRPDTEFEPSGKDPLQNQRSLNLATAPVARHSAAASHDDFDSVLPELPADSYPLTRQVLPALVDVNSDDDDTSLNDSSIENRSPEEAFPDDELPAKEPLHEDHAQPEEIVYTPPPSPLQSHDNAKQSNPSDTTQVLKPLFAPPPSPSPSQDGSKQPDAQSPELPELLSRMMSGRQQMDESEFLATDSSYEEVPPPSLLTVPVHPLSPPPPVPTDEDFTPSLAKYLVGLPPTLSTDLPSSEASEGPTNEQLQSHVSRGLLMPLSELGEASESPQRLGEEMEMQSTKTKESVMMVEHLPLHNESLPMEGEATSVPTQFLAKNPFDSIEERFASQSPRLGSLQPEHMPMEKEGDDSPDEVVADLNSEPVSPTHASDSKEPLESSESRSRVTEGEPEARENPQELSTDSPKLSSGLPTNNERAESKEMHISSDAMDSQPIESSVRREPRRRRQQTSTTSVFETGLDGSLKQLPMKPSNESIENPLGQCNVPSPDGLLPLQTPGGSSTAASVTAEVALPPRTAKVTKREEILMTDGIRSMDVEKKRNVAAVTEYQPAEKRQTPLSNSNIDKQTGLTIKEGQQVVTSSAKGTNADRRLQGNVGELETEAGPFKAKRNRKGSAGLRSREEEERLGRKEQARREKLKGEFENIGKSRSDSRGKGDVPTNEMAGLKRGVSEVASDSEQDIFHDAHETASTGPTLAPELRRSSSRRGQKSRHRHRREPRHDKGFYNEASSSEGDACGECVTHRHYDSYQHEEPSHSRSRSRPKSESSGRRVYDDDNDSQSFYSDQRSVSSRTRSKSDKRSIDSRHLHEQSSSRDRSHRSKKSRSKDKRPDRVEKAERSLRSEGSEKGTSKSRSKSGERKRSHDKSKSSKKSSSREVDPEKRRRDGKSKSKSKHRNSRSQSSLHHSHRNNDGAAKPIYRHRLPDSDSGIENPIPWYCDGQSAPEDTDMDVPKRHTSSDSDTHVAEKITTTTVYSSYGRRDKYGRRHRAHHNRSVTFLYDNV